MKTKIFNKERELIFASALKLIREGRYVNSTRSEVAYHADLSERTTQFFYRTQDGLTEQLSLHVRESIQQLIRMALEEETTFRGKFFRIWLNLYYYYKKNPGVLAFIEHCEELTSNLDHPVTSQWLFADVIGLFEASRHEFGNDLSTGALLAIFNGNIAVISKTALNTTGFNEEDLHTMVGMLYNGMTSVKSAIRTTSVIGMN
jgi:TetR/AcrR family transcriptional regulator, multidrug resistance operon repressor